MKEIPIEILERMVFKKPRKNEDADTDLQFPPLERIVHPVVACADCAQPVCDRRVDYKRNVKPYPHWKVTCAACGMIWNPDTKCYDLDQNQYRNYINQQNDKINAYQAKLRLSRNKTTK